MLAALVTTSTHVHCLCGELRKDGSYVVEGETSAAFSGLKRAKAVSSLGIKAAAVQAIERMEEHSGVRIDEVHVGVPGAYCETVLASHVPESAGEAGEQTPPSAFEYMDDQCELIHRVKVPGGLSQAGRSDVASILARREFIAEMNGALAALRMRPVAYCAQNYLEGMFIIPHSARNQVAVLVNVGYYNTDVCVFMGDAQVFSATLYVGGAHVASDLSQVLEIEPAHARQLIRQFAFGIDVEPGALDYVRLEDGKLATYDHHMVQEVIMMRMEETCELIRQAVARSGVELTEKSKAYLCGEGFKDLRGSREYLAAVLQMPVEGLPLSMSDGTTRYETAALALLDYLAQQPEQKTKGNRLRRFGRFTRK